MPDDINFTISIPVRTEDADNVLNAFLTLKPYANAPYQETVKDAAGNAITNPINSAMFVEDCIAFYIMEMTKSHLVNQVAEQAKAAALEAANTATNDLGTWINQNLP
jgi:hypothetical protein